ncbi:MULTISPECIES: insecticidal delta-endotoxin Cry8Ea1 family protein [Bacillus cereus group]|uniref:insecticidal delta-endotoxin Cry8Ea1 family protein n=1 Tax=Bacillus cereus group TaxID=86661 RepID=UPI000D8BE9DC|nr:insecticidal delta-endotoxin Cry8Ea1 family protein [Bacillus cereus]SPT76286.1 delta endotoxin, N-terminal domain [Bacillus cereus]
MKYKDRKDTKRKYKQALLATVATMTLGVSTLGSTASAFAEEKEAGAQQEQATTDSLGAGGGETVEDQFKEFTKAHTASLDGKGVGDLLSKGLVNMYKDAHSNKGNFNNTFRTYAMGVSEYFPYGKLFISPLLSLLWPETVLDKDNKFESLLSDMSALMDKKIEDFDITTIKRQVIALKTEMQAFERLVDSKILTDGLYSAGSPEESARTKAEHLQAKFHELINLCQKDNLSEAELPLYTTIANIHLLFLDYMDKNWNKPALQIDQKSFDDLYAEDIKNVGKTYNQHVHDTFILSNQKINKKLTDIAHGSNQKNTLEQLRKKLVSLGNDLELKKHGKSGSSSRSFSAVQSDYNATENKYDNYKKLLNEKNEYYNSTVGNKSFTMAAIGTWMQEDGKWFINKNGEKATGWFIDGDESYFLSTEDNFKNDKGETFKKKGQMVTGWLTTSDDTSKATYYFNTRNSITNAEGKTFNEGQMVTGSITAEDGKTYTFDSNGKMK